MTLVVTVLTIGVIVGLVYAIAGASLVVIYRTSGYVSFAQGDIAAVSLFVGYGAYAKLGLPYIAVAVIVVATSAVLGYLVGSLIVIPMERFGAITAVLSTVAVAVLIQGIESITVGGKARPFPSAGDQVALPLGAVKLSVADVVSLVVGVVVFVALGIVFARTNAGVAMRAVNNSVEAAELMGIPTVRLRRLSWAAAGALAGVAGLFVAPLLGLTPLSTDSLIVYAFCAVVVGGFESIFGALVAGVAIGIASNLVAVYWDSSLVTPMIFVLLTLVLVVRPEGLFGRRRVVRV